MTAVVRVAALIGSNLSNCMFRGGICDICSISGVVVVRLSKTICFARPIFLFESFAQTKWAKNKQIFRKITQKR